MYNRKHSTLFSCFFPCRVTLRFSLFQYVFHQLQPGLPDFELAITREIGVVELDTSL
jgi:hypothetical protein